MGCHKCYLRRKHNLIRSLSWLAASLDRSFRRRYSLVRSRRRRILKYSSSHIRRKYCLVRSLRRNYSLDRNFRLRLEIKFRRILKYKLVRVLRRKYCLIRSFRLKCTLVRSLRRK